MPIKRQVKSKSVEAVEVPKEEAPKEILSTEDIATMLADYNKLKADIKAINKELKDSIDTELLNELGYAKSKLGDLLGAEQEIQILKDRIKEINQNIKDNYPSNLVEDRKAMKVQFKVLSDKLFK